MESFEFLNHTSCRKIFSSSRSCGIKDVDESCNTITVDRCNKKQLLSRCSDLFESSYSSYFIHRDYKKIYRHYRPT